MDTKSRLLQYLEYKGIAPTKAELELSWGKGLISKTKSISADKVEEFLLHFADISP